MDIICVARQHGLLGINSMEKTSQVIGRRKYDLEDRALAFARHVRIFTDKLPKTIANTEYIRQLIRASGSIGANYLEANDALGAKDFVMKVRTSRREAKETRYWLRLVDVQDSSLRIQEQEELVEEAQEFVRILSAMIKSFENSHQAVNCHP